MDFCAEKHAPWAHTAASTTHQDEFKKHEKCLTEFWLIIRLVYLWFATADWLFSCSEGVFPLQKQSRSWYLVALWNPPEIYPLMEPAPLTALPRHPQHSCRRLFHRLSCPWGRLYLISAADPAVCATESDVGMEMSPPALLKPALGQSIKAAFEYSHGSANRMKEKAAAAVMPNPSK